MQNSLQSNDYKGVHLCFLPVSTAPKFIEIINCLVFVEWDLGIIRLNMNYYNQF